MGGVWLRAGRGWREGWFLSYHGGGEGRDAGALVRTEDELGVGDDDDAGHAHDA